MSDESVFVLNSEMSPEDVAKSMIEGGQQKEPFYVLNIDEPYQRIMCFKKCMPRVQIFYAMKSNDHENMLKLMVALELGFDCASPGEIYEALQMNVNPLSIIFAMPTKMAEWMTYARKVGVMHTTFDSSDELKKLKEYWPDSKLLIRVGVDGDSVYKLGEIFGCDFETEAFDLLEEAASLNLQVVGVAFHVGSACFSTNSYAQGLKYAKALFDYEKRANRKMFLVDIGGGFIYDSANRIKEASEVINAAIDKLFPDPNIQVIAEPGRFISDSSCTLYCSISNVRKSVSEKTPANMVYLNDGVFGTLRFNEPWHTVKKLGSHSEIECNKLERTILWGPSCHNKDRVMENVEVLLPKCTIYDWLVFPIQGAYSFGFSSTFSCLQKPRTRSVVSKNVWTKLKEKKGFATEDFIEDPDISIRLSSTLPKVLLQTHNFTSNATLKMFL